MNSLDIIVLALVLFLGIKGVLRGFVSEVAGFLATVGGVFVASRFGKMAAEFLTSFLSMNSTTSTIVGFIVVFGLFWMLTIVCGGFIKKALEALGLQSFDKVLGFIVSGGKIFLILSVIAFALSSITLLKSKIQSMTTGSFLYGPMVKTGSFLINLTPEDFNASGLRDGAKVILKNEINNTVQKELNKR